MFRYTAKAGRSALAVAAALTAVIAFAVPAAAASHQPAPSASSACHPVSNIGRDEHTGQLWAIGYTSCPVDGPGTMYVEMYVDNTLVSNVRHVCSWGTDCYTYTPEIWPRSGRHLYCAAVVFYWASKTPTSDSWSCEYLG